MGDVCWVQFSVTQSWGDVRLWDFPPVCSILLPPIAGPGCQSFVLHHPHPHHSQDCSPGSVPRLGDGVPHCPMQYSLMF